MARSLACKCILYVPLATPSESYYSH